MELSNTWQVVIAAGVLNCELVPVDALTFCDFYDRHRTSFRDWLTIAFVKEPQATKMFEQESSKDEDDWSKKEAFLRAWMRVIERVIVDGQDKEVLRNLTRQGTGRFTCLARVMTKIGIIETGTRKHSGPSTFAGEIFTLGLDKRMYRYCTDDSKFNEFYDALEPANAEWQKALQETDGKPFELSSFCQVTRSTLQVAGDAHPAFGLKAEGYCFDFAYRKAIIAECARSKNEVNWETSMGEIQRISADSGDHLSEVETHVVSVALSHVAFGRTDWAIMLSCFACLWSEVVSKRVDTDQWNMHKLLELLRSGTLSSLVAEYKQEHGYAPHPFILMKIYAKKHLGELDLPPTLRRKPKREAPRQTPVKRRRGPRERSH